MSISKTRHQCHEPLITGKSCHKTIVHSVSSLRFSLPRRISKSIAGRLNNAALSMYMARVCTRTPRIPARAYCVVGPKLVDTSDKLRNRLLLHGAAGSLSIMCTLQNVHGM
ncbi:hypothetical protein COCMIDRAFT_26660 [Bipolaris oryzae ATCC 44560]|uniref:Uncharacterized protein n=1 Tax=Bipolaris oryzae ATCC 44560 TaxID=930090 RepID=W6ZNB1_COCMI|nr:uncharacterized protein COCMIDRAFT_26660 [Bipolaris oryzae ATCC 44560]EUC45071.1 hypothetical protein COCMIDRAFT_26660 [Bipolaris oryzae ATCC 44560]